ncbi:hypothetical protein CTEN210_14619 [Chaetoceros tenuissimus]|uniref:Uncharacterized protein n=1 Tax=Chaetoceros tenuissimus TaxID=426638 RepID=A0AAD3HCK4_9STRA|nr:hypothetical protein CTEN210_14619 [Chaetoceros tenuissimus]
MHSFSEKALRLVYAVLIAASIITILGKFEYVTVNESHSIEKYTSLSSTRGLEEKTSLLRGRKPQYSRIKNSLLENHEMRERSSNQKDMNNVIVDWKYRDLKSAFLQKIASFTATTDMEEQIGTAVDISDDGTIIAISGIEQTYFNSELSRYIVKVWKESTAGKWVQVGQDIRGKNTTEWRDDARADVSISGDGKRLAIGNVYLPDRGLDDRKAEGTVEIFEHDLSLNSSRDWLHIATPYTDSAGGGGAHLGLKVSLDSTGSSLVVGERYHDTSSSNDHGRILVYSVASTLNGSAAVRPKGDSPIIGKTSCGHSGSSVMISGDGNCLIFGSIGDEDTDKSAAKTGSASIYCLESDIWTLRGGKVIHGDNTGDEFGSSVAINSDATFIAIGAVKYDDAKNGKNVGVVRTFRWNGTSYNEFGGPIIGEQGETTSRIDGYYAGEYSGYSVDISDVADNGMIRVVIGSPNSGGQYYHGRARLFEVDTNSDSPAWNLVVSDVGGNESSLGRSVAMSSTGKRIIVGGPTHNNENDSYYEGIVDVIEEMEYTGTPSKFPSTIPSQSPKPTNSESPSVLPSISSSQSPSIKPLPLLQENDITSSPSVQSSQAPSESNSTLASTACATDLDNVSHLLTFLRKIICFFQK